MQIATLDTGCHTESLTMGRPHPYLNDASRRACHETFSRRRCQRRSKSPMSKTVSANSTRSHRPKRYSFVILGQLNKPTRKVQTDGMPRKWLRLRISSRAGAAVTNDFDGNLRSLIPDIGVDGIGIVANAAPTAVVMAPSSASLAEKCEHDFRNETIDSLFD